MDILDKLTPLLIAEIVAVALGLTYVILIASDRPIGWWFGVFSSLISVWIFYEVTYYAESILYLYYVGMGVYGYFSWTSSSELRPIARLTPRHHTLLIALGIGLAIALAQILQLFDGANPYADATSTIFSFIATWMAARRILENWIYWIAIDAFCVWLYAVRDLPIYACLMALYTIMATGGLILWYKEFQAHPPRENSPQPAHP